MIVEASRVVRLELIERFSGPFNEFLMEACVAFGAEPFQLNLGLSAEEPQNFYEGNRSWSSLSLYQEPELPAMTMWTGEIGEYPYGVRSMPRIFHGPVIAHWRFWLSVKGLRSTGLIDLREATESAMLAVLNEEFTSCAYQKNLGCLPLIEQQWVDQDQNHVGWVQEVEYSAGFEVSA